MPNYSNGKVYEIICKITGERYIGSTVDTLARRLTKHRLLSNRCVSKNIIIRGDYYINLLDECDCENKMQLLKKEREWYDKLECINLQKPIISIEEEKEQKKIYRENNKNKIKEQNKKYREENKEYQKEYDKENKDKKKERMKIYRELNKEKIAEQNKKYYQENKLKEYQEEDKK